MLRPFSFAICCALLASTPPVILADEGWQDIKLSDCETDGNWNVQDDGSLYLKPRDGETGWQRYSSYLWLKGEYSDFAFDFEYKHDKGGNSGFYFRVPDKANPVAVGIELQLNDSFGKENAGFHDLGGIIKFTDRKHGAPLVNAAKPHGKWNTVSVRLKDNALTVIINDQKVHDKKDLSAHPIAGELQPKGYLGIQDHGLPFWVRNLRVKAL